VRARVERLGKRAAKLGVPAPVLTVVREETVPVRRRKQVWLDRVAEWEQTTEDLAEGFQHWFVVDVQGEAPRLPGGWRLGATIQHTEVGNAVRVAQDVEFDAARYRDVVPQCDQCQTVRNRRDTYVVVNETGDTRQVGSDCLRDFLGHDNPEALVKYAAEMLDLLSSMDEEREYVGGAMRDRENIHLWEYLAEVVASIDALGWMPKSRAGIGDNPTASIALGNLFARDEDRANPRPTEEQETEALATIDWVRARWDDTDVHDLNDYENNLRVATARDWIEDRETGLAASVIAYYRRETEKELKRRERRANDADSLWQGKLKERLRDLRLQFTWSREFAGWGYEDARTLVKLRDTDGNVYSFWTSHQFRAKAGDEFVVTGTVTKHDEYEGIKSTVLNRVVWEEVAA
jgi:hypothetical protein